MSLILNLQSWSGDREQAEGLARLICDIEQKPRDDVIFLLTCRFDSHYELDTINYVRSKFPRTYVHKTIRQGRGWPEGPNAMYADSHGYCIERVRNGEWKGVDGILFMEADCVPLDVNWIDHLKAEWDECKRRGKKVLGCWLEVGDCGVKHINGNCIMHTDLWREARQVLMPMSGGWDADLAGVILPRGMPSRLIYSDYGLGKPGYNEWKGCDDLWKTRHYRAVENPLHGQNINPVWLHGPKTREAEYCVRRRLLGS